MEKWSILLRESSDISKGEYDLVFFTWDVKEEAKITTTSSSLLQLTPKISWKLLMFTIFSLLSLLGENISPMLSLKYNPMLSLKTQTHLQINHSIMSNISFKRYVPNWKMNWLLWNYLLILKKTTLSVLHLQLWQFVALHICNLNILRAQVILMIKSKARYLISISSCSCVTK